METELKKQVVCMCGTRVSIPVKTYVYYCPSCEVSKSCGDEDTYGFVSEQARKDLMQGTTEVINANGALPGLG